jgi:hypothetical protein
MPTARSVYAPDIVSTVSAFPDLREETERPERHLEIAAQDRILMNSEGDQRSGAKSLVRPRNEPPKDVATSTSDLLWPRSVGKAPRQLLGPLQAQSGQHIRAFSLLTLVSAIPRIWSGTYDRPHTIPLANPPVAHRCRHDAVLLAGRRLAIIPQTTTNGSVASAPSTDSAIRCGP